MDEMIPHPAEGQSSVSSHWKALTAHLERYYHKPDLQAVRTIGAASLAHFLWPDGSPVWLMCVGASGTGKTEIAMGVMEGFPHFYALSNLTEATLLSGWKGKQAGLLASLTARPEYGKDILFGISDFSSVTSLRADKLKAVAGLLRELYDGKVSKDFGVGKHEEWQGKATMIVGCTRSVERMWSLNRDLGERFCYVRWRSGSMEELAAMALGHDDRTGIRGRTTELATRWFEGADRSLASKFDRREAERLELHQLASLVARLRCPVIRGGSEESGKAGGIVDIGDQEGPGRLVKTMWQLARAHAVFDGRTWIEREDVEVATRVARDSVPQIRWKIMEYLAGEPRAVGSSDVGRAIGEETGGGRLPDTTLRNHLEEWTVVGAGDMETSAGQNWYAASAYVRERWGLLFGKQFDK